MHLYKDVRHWVRGGPESGPTLTRYDLTLATSAKTLLPNKSPFTGTRALLPNKSPFIGTSDEDFNTFKKSFLGQWKKHNSTSNRGFVKDFIFMFMRDIDL